MKQFATAMVLLSLVMLGCMSADAEASVRYVIDSTDRSNHHLHVSVILASGHEESIFRLPTWYALYQIRNFSQYVENPSAFSRNGKHLPVRSLDKTSWIVPHGTRAHRFEYDINCDLKGPYGLEVSADRLLINPALLLVLTSHTINSPAEVLFVGLPSGWKVFSPLSAQKNLYRAESYEQLTDSPFWIGRFAEEHYNLDGTEVSIVVDAEASIFDLQELKRRNRKIVVAEKEWMRGLPLRSYLFLYQFPDRDGVEGMEHARATAISVPASAIKKSIDSIDNVTAHEFFHLWNITRLRPCSLEPVDFTHEQYSRTLWFSEGVTSAVSRSILLRSGLINEEQYIRRLSDSLDQLQDTPARRWQSAEDASVSVWLSGSNLYDSPDRSISYYRKGELLGVLLDLMIRKETGGSKSLRDVFWSMEQVYGKEHRCFNESQALEKTVESVTGRSAAHFFKDYVSGTAELPFNDYLNYVGLTSVPVTSPSENRSHFMVVDMMNVTQEERQNRESWLGIPR